MVFTRLPLTTTSRRRGAWAWAVAAPMSAHPVKNTKSLRVVIDPPPSLLAAEPARYSDGDDFETDPARGHRKRRAGTFPGAHRRSGAEREPGCRGRQRRDDRSMGVRALPGADFRRARRRQAAVQFRAAARGRASAHRAVRRPPTGLRSGARRLGRAAAHAPTQARRDLGPRRPERLQLARAPVRDGGLRHRARGRADASARRRRACHAPRRRGGAARQLARLDQPARGEPHGVHHDGSREALKPVRRLVTVDDVNGRSRALADGPAPAVHADAGFSSALVWYTDRTPARLDTGPLHAPYRDSPPPGGSLCRVFCFPPGTQSKKQQARSLDFCLVLEGEITLVLDLDEVHLKAGDTVVQRGTRHAWSNRSGKPCVVAISSHDAHD